MHRLPLVLLHCVALARFAAAGIFFTEQPQGCQKFGFCPSSRILRCLSWDSDGHLTYFSSIRISLINARARSRNPDPDIRSHVRLEGVHIAYSI